MSRHGYSDDYSNEWHDIAANGRWKASLNRAIKGKRGQAFLRAFIDQLESMPLDKRELGADSITEPSGAMCSLGVMLHANGKPAPSPESESYLGPFEGWEEWETREWWTENAGPAIAEDLNIAKSMAEEIMYVNDEWFNPPRDCPRQRERRLRWAYMLRWAKSKLVAGKGAQ